MHRNHQFIRNLSSKYLHPISSRIEDYDVVINPGSRLFDKFMTEHGSKRFDFKKEDYSTWKSSWGKRLQTRIVLDQRHELKIWFSLFTQFNTNLLEFNRIFDILEWRGFLNDTEEKEILKAVTDYLGREEQMRSQNMLACNVHWSQNFWKQATGKSDISSCTYYISYYEMPEFQIPKIEDDNGIVVKNVNTKTVSDVLKYDRAIFPFNREIWMKSLFLEGIGRVAYDSNGDVIGIGCLSIYPSGECVISPLYANETKVAQIIFRSILEEISTMNVNIWRFQIRSNDQCRESYEWIEPFLKCPLRRSHLSNLCYSIYAPRYFFDFSKVFVNAHPTNGPC